MSESNVQLSGVPRTMVLTLRGRADEHDRPDGLFQDDRAAAWIKSLPWDKELEEFYNPVSQIAWAVRAKLFDEVAERHIANFRYPLIVELGAGLSSRYHRVGKDRSIWIDLDLPVVTEIRQQLDTETNEHQFIRSSVMDFNWMDALPKREPESILFIAEGLLMYFEINELQQLINEMRRKFPGATLVMDVVGNSSKKTGSKLAQLGAPIKWYARDERDVEALGLSLVNVRSFFRSYPERWPLMVRLLSWIPYIRNGCLVVETKLNPLVQTINQ
ncbi:MAG: class I SAM-dependent methyltransferase [Oscillatoriales cyanobacterium]|uniref:class I SAM-dependent methyltransferase n=1 Tax=Microcoleus sp. PH2017_05_CCC_O_A TaxID=2798816 RepID=UPI001DE4FFB0|nr:class I SAM-dependent methyltransferase [Microcoleus sp. PH2017_05_CCC_O_A]MCC3433984.1 class I SAM-dependent methyltransferase [Microcoleus sp. PH2017_05_CCC_O_A]TAG08075.1 MAG: class I SAM-dependent methyltransferase [Oscillatoriales cyanobacterium]TAG17521.1 MAG: class I SAM-dependent methyltransferase [Oscillatoriales cyanobacterium]TAG45598.1 MAG: class I SAM-dependent methyltransferase [Oscillatoriales cyanobacterium]